VQVIVIVSLRAFNGHLMAKSTRFRCFRVLDSLMKREHAALGIIREGCLLASVIRRTKLFHDSSV